MAKKSFLEIDILDEKFQAFAAEFDKFSKQIKTTPAEMNKFFSASMAGVKNTSAEIDKATKKQKDYNKTLKDGHKIFSDTARTTGTIAKNMANTVLSVTKWLGLSSLLSVGGITALAKSVSNERTFGITTGTSTGRIRAAENVYGQLFPEVKNIIGSINAQRYFPIQGAAIQRLGANPNDDPVTIFQTLIKNLREKYKNEDPSTLGLLYEQVDQVNSMIPFETLLTAKNLKDQEFNKLEPDLNKVEKTVTTEDRADKSLQELTTALDIAGRQIKVGFIDVLTPFIPTFKYFLDMIGTFVSENGKSWGENAYEGFQIFGRMINGTPENPHRTGIDNGAFATTANAMANLNDKIVGDKNSPVSQVMNTYGRVGNETREHFFGSSSKNLGLSEGEEVVDIQSKFNSFKQLLEKTRANYKKEFNKEMPINSLERARAKEQDLYDRWLKGEKGIYMPLNPKDFPYRELFHEGALDTNVDPAWMEKEGWKRPLPQKDPIHYIMKDQKTSLNIFDQTGGNIFYTTSAMSAIG